MAFQITIIMAGLIVGWLKKGSLWSITNIRLKFIWLLPISYVLQHLSIRYFTGSLYEIVIVLSYVTLIAFCCINIRTPGLVWTLAGTCANFLVMLVNGLRMPAYIAAVKRLEPSLVPVLLKGDYEKSVAMSSQTHLNFLGDIFSYEIHPQSLISVGDILFGIGLVILIQFAMRNSSRGGLRVERPDVAQ